MTEGVEDIQALIMAVCILLRYAQTPLQVEVIKFSRLSSGHRVAL
jgi:hypothetical protein